MRLTRYTDFGMRVLIYLAACPGRICSIQEVSGAYGISQNHLMKVVSELARHGYVASLRGRSGGIRLSRPPEEINIGEVVRRLEEDFVVVDCATCVIGPACGLACLFREATAAFLRVLDERSLADVMTWRADLAALLKLVEGTEPAEDLALERRRAGVGPATEPLEEAG